MSDLEILLAQPMAQAIGWALIHFLWQGLAVGALLAGALFFLRKRSANARYLASCAALLLMLIVPVATAARINESMKRATAGAEGDAGGSSDWFHRGHHHHGEGKAEHSGKAYDDDHGCDRSTGQAAPAGLAAGSGDLPRDVSGSDSNAAAPSLIAQLGRRVEPFFSWLVPLWLAGVLAMSVRLAGGWYQARMLTRRGIEPAAPSILKIVERLSERLGIRKTVAIMESAVAQVPAAVGWIRPMILLPASTITGLSPDQLQAMIAHELAHVRRHDYLVNLFQSVVETLLFYHPVVWWISGKIREEREYCCDDLAVAVCGDAVDYARALTEMEILRAGRPQLAMAATGGSLLHRIRRLVEPQPQRGHLFSGMMAWVAVLGAVLAVAASARLSVARPDALPPSTLLLSKDADLRREIQSEIAERRAALNGRDGKGCLSALRDEDWMTRSAAARCLADAEKIEVLPALEEALDDPVWWVRKEAAYAIGALGLDEAPGGLLDLLGDEDPGVRELAARSLGEIGDPVAGQPLKVAIHDRSPEVREAALWALELLESGAREETEPFEPLSEKEIQKLLEKLESKDGDERLWAVRALGERGRAREVAIQGLARELTGEEGEEPAASEEPAEEPMPFREAILGALEETAEEDPDPRVREMAAWAAEQIEPAFNEEREAAETEEAAWEERQAVARRLVESVVPSSAGDLIRALENEDDKTREAAARALGDLGRREAVGPLMGALEDREWPVRRAAAESLGLIGDKKAFGALEKCLEDPEAPVRAAAERALERIESGSSECCDSEEKELDAERETGLEEKPERKWKEPREPEQQQIEREEEKAREAVSREKKDEEKKD